MDSRHFGGKALNPKHPKPVKGPGFGVKAQVMLAAPLPKDANIRVSQN